MAISPVRHALLIGAEVRYPGDPAYDIDKEKLSARIEGIAETLRGLSRPYDFRVRSRVSQPRTETLSWFETQIAEYGKKVNSKGADNSDCLLIYYFGHGLNRNNGNLSLMPTGSDSDDPNTLLGFNVLVHRMEECIFDIPNVIIILDCCRAGLAWNNLSNYPHPCCLIAASAADQLAYSEPDYKLFPYGKFSNRFFSNIDSEKAEDPGTNNVSAISLFNVVAPQLNGQNPQIQYLQGAERLILTEVGNNIQVHPDFEERAPRRTFYYQIKWLSDHIYNGSNTLQKIYNLVKKEMPTEMTRVRFGPDTEEGSERIPLSKDEIERLLSKMRWLGFVKQGTPIELTSDGHQLIANVASQFNTVLEERINSVLQPSSLALTDIRRIVRRALTTGHASNSKRIFRDAVQQNSKLSLSEDDFKVILELAVRIGWLRGAHGRSYFLR
jgi:hypothetical protein